MFLKEKSETYALCKFIYFFGLVLLHWCLYTFLFGKRIVYGKGINFVCDSPSVLRAKETGKGEDQPFAWKMDPACMGEIS